MTTNRRIFLATLGASIGSAVVRTEALDQRRANSAEQSVVQGGESSRLWVLGILLTIKADTHITGGGYSITENFVRPGQGVPLHLHTREDEAIYVVEGEVRITIGDLQRTARPGDVAHMPRNIPHRFQNVSDRAARMVLVFSPGGIENLFREIGKPVVGNPGEQPPKITPEDLQRAREAAERYGGKWL
jgi:quercetin dioxygenase-like cupin family protein